MNHDYAKPRARSLRDRVLRLRDVHVSLLIRNGIVLTMNDAFDIVEGDVSIRDGRIAAIGAVASPEPHDRVIDARGGYLLPGFIQTHIHLCQTLFRGYADDLPLMDWLRTRVWPMEAAHTPATLARRGAARHPPSCSRAARPPC